MGIPFKLSLAAATLKQVADQGNALPEASGKFKVVPAPGPLPRASGSMPPAQPSAPSETPSIATKPANTVGFSSPVSPVKGLR